MRDDRDWERALEAIANGSSIRRCGIPKSTILNRAQRDAKFERQLAAAQQNGRLRLVAKLHIDAGKMDRDELVGIIAREARDGRGWACKLMLELLDTEPSSSVIPDRFLEVLNR